MASAPSRKVGVSRLFGERGERWSLARAVDALGDSARLAGRPGWIWLAGLVYPALTFNPGFGLEGNLRGQGLKLQIHDVFGVNLAVALVALPLLARVWAGLARVSSPDVWRQHAEAGRPPRLAEVWRAGQGLTSSALGLWLQLALLGILGSLLLVVLPAVALSSLEVEPVLAAVALGPLTAWLIAYVLVLSMLLQLALHSLAQNRRGTASAFVHAWRIARNDPWATLRAVLVDLLLFATVQVISGLLGGLLASTCVGIALVWLPLLGLSAFSGVVRCCYWARAYRALGGLAPEDHVPGLAQPPSAAR